MLSMERRPQIRLHSNRPPTPSSNCGGRAGGMPACQGGALLWSWAWVTRLLRAPGLAQGTGPGEVCSSERQFELGRPHILLKQGLLLGETIKSHIRKPLRVSKSIRMVQFQMCYHASHTVNMYRWNYILCLFKIPVQLCWKPGSR